MIFVKCSVQLLTHSKGLVNHYEYHYYYNYCQQNQEKEKLRTSANILPLT